MHPISECSGANRTFMVSILIESHSLMVLSSEHVIIFGSSGIVSFVFYASLLGSSAMIFKIESVWPSMSWVFYPILILKACMLLSVKTNKMLPKEAVE